MECSTTTRYEILRHLRHAGLIFCWVLLTRVLRTGAAESQGFVRV
jgi:hypothetical protein